MKFLINVFKLIDMFEMILIVLIMSILVLATSIILEYRNRGANRRKVLEVRRKSIL